MTVLLLLLTSEQLFQNLEMAEQDTSVLNKGARPKQPSVFDALQATPKLQVKAKFAIGRGAALNVSMSTPILLPGNPGPSIICVPNLPSCLGDDPRPKGECPYYEWIFETKCVQADPDYNYQGNLQAIHRSLSTRGRK